MNAPRLNVTATSRSELLNRLASIDIAVPLRTEGRTTGHREQYMTARLLSTLAQNDLLSFPLRLEHREKPDFALHLPIGSIGIECVEAVSEEWAQIEAIREDDFPDALIMLPMLRPGRRIFTLQERIRIASGAQSGPPWVGDMPKHQWADAIAFFVRQKTEKLRAGNYSDFSKNWLLIQDEWCVPLYREEERRCAAELCLEKIRPLLVTPSFEAIFIGNSKWLLQLAPAPVQVFRMHSVWS